MGKKKIEEEENSRKPAQYLCKNGFEEIIVLVTGNTKELPLLGRSYRTCYRKYGGVIVFTHELLFSAGDAV